MKTIFVTGLPGVGKTTLIKKIVEKLKNHGISVNGFYTEEVRNEMKQRIGFDIVSLTDGKRVTLADKRDVPSSPNIRKLGQYTVYIKNIEDFAVPIIIPNLNQTKSMIVIDEIGKMELFSKKFEETVENIFKNKNTVVIATLPVKGPPFVNHLKQNKHCQIFEVTETSRNHLVDEIMQVVMSDTSLYGK